MDAIRLVVALFGGLFTMVMSHIALKQSTLQNPVIPVAVGIIAGMGVYRAMGDQGMNVILVGYTALPFAFLALLIIMALLGGPKRWRRSNTWQQDESEIKKDYSDIEKNSK